MHILRATADAIIKQAFWTECGKLTRVYIEAGVGAGGWLE